MKFLNVGLADLIHKFGLGLLLAAAVLALFAASPAHAADATVNWTHPTQRVDNTALALTDIRETKVEWALCATGGVFPAAPLGTVAVPAPAATTVITGLGYGFWCFRARTVDLGGRESAPSLTVTKQYIAPPKPPVLTVATLAYDLTSRGSIGKLVGRVPLGTACVGDPVRKWADGSTFYEVPMDAVTLTRAPRSAIVVAKCALQG